MSDLVKRQYRGAADRAHADTELALRLVRADLTGDSLEFIPDDSAQWAGAPTTIGEALNRLAQVIFDNHGVIP